MNNKNYQVGHHTAVPTDWLPKLKPPTPPKSTLLTKKSEKKSEDTLTENDDKKIKGKSTMSLAKQKAYERMLADLERQEEAMRREKERLDNITDEEMKAKKEAERLKRLAVIEERERRVRERAQRKLDRDGAVLKKRREQDAKMKAYKEEQERLVMLEIETKTKHTFDLKGSVRPDGRIQNMKIKEKGFMYYGDSAAVGKEKNDELKKKWGKFADPDLYFWVPHGYGDYRNHGAEEPFMEGEMVSGVMSGMGIYRYGEEYNNGEYKGTFLNDRPQGFGVISLPTGNIDEPYSHRLAVYQRGKEICFLDELKPGARIKLYGQEHFDFVTDARNIGIGAQPSTLPIMPHKNVQFRSATILESAGSMGVFRVKPDFGPSMIVNLKSTLWDLDKASIKPLFQGVELYTGETDESRFTFDPLAKKKSHQGESDHRENFFSESSRVKNDSQQNVEKQKLANKMYAEHKAKEAEKKKAEEEKQRLKDDRKEARKLMKLQKKESRREAAEEEKMQREIGKEYVDKIQKQQRALHLSRRNMEEDEDDDDDEYDENGLKKQFDWKNRKPIQPNSGRLLLDEDRWTFLANAESLRGPPKPIREEDEDDKKNKKIKTKRNRRKSRK